MFFVESKDSAKIAVYDPNPCGKETILLIHGWPLTHEMYEYQVQFLLDRDYRVITLDLRGFGNSDVTKCGYTYDDMAEDIYIVIKRLELKQIILGGFSMGGAIVLRYMRKYCGYEIKKLMLFAAAAPCWTQRPGFSCGISREKADELIEQARTDRPQLARDFAHNMLFASCHSDAAKDWFENIALDASGYATVQMGIALRDEDGREDLCSVHVPAAVFQGKQDIVVPEELTNIQFETIPFAILYRFECSGHGIVYDELQYFNECMLEFICE